MRKWLLITSFLETVSGPFSIDFTQLKRYSFKLTSLEMAIVYILCILFYTIGLFVVEISIP